MNIFKRIYGHLKTVLKHKYYVFYYARMCGITWRGLKHDMSKLEPVELFESIRYYSGDCSPIENCKRAEGYSKAWFHHRSNNSHHYEMWVDNYDHGGQMLIMPFEDCVEMLCDYLAAARTYAENQGKEFTFKSELDWWVNRMRMGLSMNSAMKYFLTTMFVELSNNEDNPKSVLKYDWLHIIYKHCINYDDSPEFIINDTENKAKVEEIIKYYDLDKQ